MPKADSKTPQAVLDPEALLRDSMRDRWVEGGNLSLVEEIVRVLELGVYDGAHHKDWCIQQALKRLYAITDQQLKDFLNRCGWEEGIPP